MPSHSRLSLNVPGEHERELWCCEPGKDWHRLEGKTGFADTVFAIETLALQCLPFWALAPQDGKIDLESVAELKWETFGGEASDEGKSWMHWQAGRTQNQVLVVAAGIAEGAPVDTWLKVLPQTFELSPRLYPIPEGELVIWRELDRIVVAVSRADQLVYFAGLSSHELDARAALEIRDLVAALRAHEFLLKPMGARVWTSCVPDFVATLKEMLGAPVVQEPKPTPRLPADQCPVLPAQVARAHRARARRRQTAQIVMALAALYVLFFAAWGGWLYWREMRLNKDAAQADTLRPRVARVESEQARWAALEQATNPDLYPTEVFQRLVALLPPEGIRFKEFQMELDRVVISGEASSPDHALRFKAAVLGSPGLKRYTWNFPQPTILDDRRANFRAEGLLGTGGAQP